MSLPSFGSISVRSYGRLVVLAYQFTVVQLTILLGAF